MSLRTTSGHCWFNWNAAFSLIFVSQFLACNHQHHQQWYVPKCKPKQLSRGVTIPFPVEVPRQVWQVHIQWERVGHECPVSETYHRCQPTQSNHAHAVSQRDPLAHLGLDDAAHAVTSPGVVWAQVPTQRVEVWKLPGVQDSSKQPGT